MMAKNIFTFNKLRQKICYFKNIIYALTFILFIFFFLILFYIEKANKEKTNAYIFFKKKIIKIILKKEFENVNFKSFPIDFNTLADYNFLPRSDEQKQTFNINFSYKNLQINNCFLKLETITRNYYKNTYYTTVFRGLIYKISLLSDKEQTFILKRKKIDSNKLEKIETKNIEFNNMFNLYTNHKTKTSDFLNLPKMNNLISFIKEEENKNIDFLLNNQNLYIIIKSENSIAEPSFKKDLSKKDTKIIEKNCQKIKNLLDFLIINDN